MSRLRIIFIWVEEGLIGEIEDPFEAEKWQQVSGGEGFLRRLKDQWNNGIKEPRGPRIMERRKTGQLAEPSRTLSGRVSTFNPILRGLSNAACATIWPGGARLRCAGITPD
jgi:hypothetical protein